MESTEPLTAMATRVENESREIEALERKLREAQRNGTLDLERNRRRAWRLEQLRRRAVTMQSWQ